MISIYLNADAVLSKLTDLEKTQLPYAMKLGLNRTAEEVQKAQARHLGDVFDIRRPWVQQYGIKIGKGDFATKDKASVTIQVNPDASFLIKFEDQTVKRPRGGGKALAIPIEARRNKSDIVQSAQRPRAFQFTNAHSSVASRTTIYKGNKRTFMIQKADGSGVIFQRMSRAVKGTKRTGRDPNLKLLYILRPTAPIKPVLKFFEIGKATAQARFAVNLQGMLAYAIKTAK